MFNSIKIKKKDIIIKAFYLLIINIIIKNIDTKNKKYNFYFFIF